LIVDKGTENICWRKDNLFNKQCCENWIATCKRQKLDPPHASACTKISSKWIKDLNAKPETL
jgi:hypothetical protein